MKQISKATAFFLKPSNIAILSVLTVIVAGHSPCVLALTLPGGISVPLPSISAENIESSDKWQEKTNLDKWKKLWKIRRGLETELKQNSIDKAAFNSVNAMVERGEELLAHEEAFLDRTSQPEYTDDPSSLNNRENFFRELTDLIVDYKRKAISQAEYAAKCSEVRSRQRDSAKKSPLLAEERPEYLASLDSLPSDIVAMEKNFEQEAVRLQTLRNINKIFREEKNLAFIPANHPINSLTELHQSSGTIIPVRLDATQYLNIYSPNPALASMLEDYEWRLIAIQAAVYRGIITCEQGRLYRQLIIVGIRLIPGGQRVLDEMIKRYKSSNPEEIKEEERLAKKNVSDGFLNGANVVAILNLLLTAFYFAWNYKYIHTPQLHVTEATLSLARSKAQIEAEIHQFELIKKRLEIEKLELEKRELESRIARQKSEQFSETVNQRLEDIDYLGNDYY